MLFSTPHRVGFQQRHNLIDRQPETFAAEQVAQGTDFIVN
jgi:hypothetical protein